MFWENKKLRSVESLIYGLPHQATVCYEKNKGLILPEKVPYIGMGSSYYAAQVLRYLGKKIYPEIASEYYYYLEKVKQFDKAVLISLSGTETETLWCADRFEKFVCIVHDTNGSLASHHAADVVVDICAGSVENAFLPGFINTLVVLYLGHGIDPYPAILYLEEQMAFLKQKGDDMARILYSLLKRKRNRGFYIIGSGPGIGIARHAAVLLSSAICFPFFAVPAAQFEYGSMGTLKQSVILAINPPGAESDRTTRLLDMLRIAGNECLELKTSGLPEHLSPFVQMVVFFFMADFLMKKFKIKQFKR